VVVESTGRRWPSQREAFRVEGGNEDGVAVRCQHRMRCEHIG